MDDLDSLREVVIKADAEHLMRGMTNQILKRRFHDHKNVEEGRIGTADLLEEIDEQFQLATEDVSCCFRPVSRGESKQADELAN